MNSGTTVDTWLATRRHPELRELTGWEWTYLSTVDLLVGYHAAPGGMCTLYIDSAERATLWSPGNPVRGALAEIVPLARRACGEGPGR